MGEETPSRESLTVRDLEKRIKLCHDLLDSEKRLNRAEISKEMIFFLKKSYKHCVTDKFRYNETCVVLHFQKGNKDLMVEYYPRINHIYIYYTGFKIITIENGEKEDYADAYCRLLDIPEFVHYKLPKKVYNICNGQISTIKHILKVLRKKEAEFSCMPIRQDKRNIFLIISKWRYSNLNILGKDLVKMICQKVIC